MTPRLGGDRAGFLSRFRLRRAHRVSQRHHAALADNVLGSFVYGSDATVDPAGLAVVEHR
jgi:hypothetical protein